MHWTMLSNLKSYGFDKGRDVTSPVGIIGLGLLGSAIVDRLLSHGFLVYGYDLDESKRKGLTDSGGQGLSNPEEVVATCFRIVLSLPTSQIAQEVVRRGGSLWTDRHLVIDTTTGDPQQMVAIADDLESYGAAYLESCVAGSSEQLRHGSAVLFVGGDSDSADAQSVLSALSDRVVHLGDVGSASRFKLVHNLALGLHRAVLAEALTFAEALGFDPSQTVAILRGTPAASRVMESKGNKMAQRDYAPQATLAQHLKDVQLILQEAERSGALTPLSHLHRALLQQAVQLGYGKQDNSAILEAFRSGSAQEEGKE